MNPTQPSTPLSTLSLGERIAGKIDPDMTLSLPTGEHGQLAFANLAQIMEVAKVVAISREAIPGHLRDNVGACLAICIQASEWQMSPFAVANKSYVVNNRMAFEAQLINAVILRRAPIVGRFKIEYTGKDETRQCRVSVKVKDGDAIEVVEYESPEFRKITVKNSPLWKGDPDQQLFYYSSRAMCRRHFPDVLLGIYTPDELAEETTPRDVTPIPGKPAIGNEAPAEQRENPEPERKPEPAPKQTKDKASQPPAPREEQPKEISEPERRKMCEEVNEMRDAAGISMVELRQRVASLGWAGPKDLMANYPAVTLQEIKNNWQQILDMGAKQAEQRQPAEQSATAE